MGTLALHTNSLKVTRLTPLVVAVKCQKHRELRPSANGSLNYCTGCVERLYSRSSVNGGSMQATHNGGNKLHWSLVELLNRSSCLIALRLPLTSPNYGWRRTYPNPDPVAA